MFFSKMDYGEWQLSEGECRILDMIITWMRRLPGNPI